MYNCCYLHVGMPRAGSKAIQRSLTENRDQLASAGYDTFLLDAEFNSSNLAVYANRDVPDAIWALAASGGSWEELCERTERTFSEVGVEGSPDRSVIISCEHLFEFARSIESWARLRSLLANLAERLVVVMFLRRQDRVAISLADQAIHEGGGVEVPLLPEADDPRRSMLRYSGLIETLHEVLSGGDDQIIVTALDEAGPRSDVVQEFFDAIGVADTSRFTSVPRLRESLASAAQTFLAHFNRNVPYLVDGAVNPLRGDIVDILYGVKGKRRLPVKGRAKKFLSGYLEDNDRVLDLIGQSDAGSKLFDMDFSDYPEDPLDRSLTVQRAVAIASLLWKNRTAEINRLQEEVDSLRAASVK